MMEGREKFSLNWNKFDIAARDTLKSVHLDKNFANVTLACDDDQQIEAHKIILSSASQFFKKVLLNNLHPHPLIYLSGLKIEELRSIIEFIYLGETEVEANNLPRFLDVSRNLKVRGLQAEEGLRTPVMDMSEPPTSYDCSTCDFKTEQENEIDNHIQQVHTGNIQCNPKIEKVVEELKVKLEMGTTANQSGLEHSKYKENFSENTPSKLYPCDECDYKATRTDHLRRHKIRLHTRLSDTRAPDKVFSGMNTPQHTTTYDCSKCDFKTEKEKYLDNHIQQVHIDKKQLDPKLEKDYEDLKVELEIGITNYLTTNRPMIEQGKDEEINLENPPRRTHPCDDCDYKAKRAEHLKRHKIRLHAHLTETMSNVDERDDLKMSRNINQLGYKETDILPHISENQSSKEYPIITESKMNEISKSDVADKRHRSGKFECEHCEFTSSRGDNLKRHIETMHTIDRQFYSCECGMVFTRKDKLQTHKNKVHGNK